MPAWGLIRETSKFESWSHWQKTTCLFSIRHHFSALLERVGCGLNYPLFYQGEEFQVNGCKLLCTKVEDSLAAEENSVYAELQTVRFDSHLSVCSPEELIRRRYHCSSNHERVDFNLGHPNFHPHGPCHTGQDWEIHHVGSQQTYPNPIQTSANLRNNLHDDSGYLTSFLTPPTIPSPPMDHEYTPGLWQIENDSRYEDITSDSGAESSDQTPRSRNLFNRPRTSGKCGQKRRHSASGDTNSRRRQRTRFSQEQVGPLNSGTYGVSFQSTRGQTT